MIELCSFYGINLNQNVVLQQIGFAGKSGAPWTRLWDIAIGNIIITALGFVPGTLMFFSQPPFLLPFIHRTTNGLENR